jgi:heme-degrading monooxygenase HmoA
MWRGWTDGAMADTHVEWLLTELFPEFETVPGFLGVELLRRDYGQEVEFVVLTRFRDLNHVQAFAGEDVDAAVIPARGAELLSRYDTPRSALRDDHLQREPVVPPRCVIACEPPGRSAARADGRATRGMSARERARRQYRRPRGRRQMSDASRVMARRIASHGG